jgi:endonuclease III
MLPPKNCDKTAGGKGLRRRTHQIGEILKSEYDSPRHGNPDDPLDDLVFILLSTMTTGPSYERVYRRLREVTGSWEVVADMDPDTLAAMIRDAGLSRQKAPRILAILNRIRKDFENLSLAHLHEWNDLRVERYLTSLPGVGLKTAKCVMMYTLGRDVLPVDTHVMRVARRLNLLATDVPYSKIHSVLEAIVLPKDRYAFHVNVLAHGRSVCQAKRPRCHECCLNKTCTYLSKVNKL